MNWYRNRAQIVRRSQHTGKLRQMSTLAAAGACIGLLLAAVGAIASVPPADVAASGAWAPTGALNTARYVHTAALLPAGTVLAVGGFYNPTSGAAVLASAEIYNPTTGTWSYTGSMSTPRANNVLAVLANGQVLVAGGTDNVGTHLATAEVYNPTTGLWTTVGSMSQSHIYATATLLRNGQVLVAGGCCGSTITLNGAELYNPETGLWSVTGSLNGARYAHTATLLPNGQVLVSGGRYQTAGSSSAPSLNTAELYDPASGHWTATGLMLTPRSDHTATLLPNGKVLVAGGEDCTATTCTPLATAELYDPRTGTWTATGSMSTPRYVDTATLLSNGQVLIAGGMSSFGTYVPAAALYDPATGRFTDDAPLLTPRYDHSATLLQNGQVLVAGGNTPSGLTASSELYTPSTSTGTPTPTPTATATATATATPAPPTPTATPVPTITIGGDWRVGVTFPQTQSTWMLAITQSPGGVLSGTVDRLGSDCTGTMSGSLHGKTVSMVWRLKASCAGETMRLSGSVMTNGTTMRGKVADNKLGSGTFVAHKQK